MLSHSPLRRVEMLHRHCTASVDAAQAASGDAAQAASGDAAS